MFNITAGITEKILAAISWENKSGCMLQKTRAIVLQVTEYSEASIIVHAYTATHGLQSFLVNSVRKPKARFAANLFQPLSLVELVAYVKKPGGLHRVSEAAASPAYQTIPYDTVKTTVA